MTLDRFDRFPGLSRGYAVLPEALRRKFVRDIPRWNDYVRQEAEVYGFPYVDMIGDFPSRLDEAESMLVENCC
jgi:hypothetical protein